MASSSSVSNRSAYRSAKQVRRRCDCDEPVGRWTSWKPKNPGRRFLVCPNYKVSVFESLNVRFLSSWKPKNLISVKCKVFIFKSLKFPLNTIQFLHYAKCHPMHDKEKDCKFFEWIDPPLPNNWYKQMIYDFHNQGIYGVNDEEFEDFMNEDVEEVVQQIPLQVEGGMVVKGWKISCLVGLIAIIWLMFM
ncbi:unnamed protein product [Lactuca saligna]|uniref:Zinc finger GRF-type domain-containing protein n=1 Tax=Lactuca saligna TaxID=75948 RepID=A0AA36E1I5_LACSI|nr:unnamed protein product [Lactuca saligna]